MDTVDAATRSRIMRSIRGRDTGPELRLRSRLHRAGLRFRVHDVRLPGTPDIVLPRHRVVVRVLDCFWHGHPGCYREPRSNVSFGRDKIERNRRRDRRQARELRRMGWRVFDVWECRLEEGARRVVRALEGGTG